MKRLLANFLKYNKFMYTVYYYTMSFCMNVLRLFVKTDDHLVLFNAFAGRKFDDSPKAIFDVMKDDPRFENYRLVWAFHEPNKYLVDGAEKIKTDGLAYFKNALAARVWITNSSIERGLHFKGKNTLYLNTWHGSPIKKMGSDISSDNQSFVTKSKNLIDFMNTQSCFEADIFTKCFGIPRDHFIEVGLPRNDILANYSKDKVEQLKRELDIPNQKKVILYCPTFREYAKTENLGIALLPPMDLKKWEKALGDRYILLFRAHYEVSKVMDFQENDFVRDVTEYPSLNDLMIVSDILISDYSSIFFDYSIMNKVMLHFTYDYDEYEEKRGMYFDVRKLLSGSDNENDLIDYLNSMDYYDEIERTVAFRNKYMNFYGNAAKQTVDFVADQLFRENDR